MCGLGGGLTGGRATCDDGNPKAGLEVAIARKTATCFRWLSGKGLSKQSQVCFR